MKYKYLSDGSQTFVGVPARDLTEEDWKELDEGQRKKVADSEFYEAVSQGTSEKSEAFSATSAEEDEE